MLRRHASRTTILLAAAGLLMLGCGDDRDSQDGAADDDAGQDAAVVDNPEPDDGDEDIPGRRDDGEGGTALGDPGEGGADDGQDAAGQDAAGQDAAGQEGAGQEGAGQDVAGTGDTAGDFDDIPLPQGADEAGELTERDGATSQSFFVQETPPEEIMDFFSNALDADGWTVVEPVSERGTDSYAGAWTRDGRRLEISSLLAQGVEDERTQFSVVLLPGLEPGEGIEGG